MKSPGFIYSWIVVIGLVLILVLIGLAGYNALFNKSDVCECKKSSAIGKEEFNAEYPYFADIDKKLEDTAIQIGDTCMIEELWNNQKYIYSQQDNLLADVRQETNNLIDKVTSELNFWVAVLAFLGVLVPIAITHKGEREARIWLEKKETIYEEKIRNSIIGIELKSKQLSELSSRSLSDLTRWRSDTEEKIAKTNKEQKRLIQELRIQRDVDTLASIRNNRFIESDYELRKAYSETAILLIERFMSYFKINIENYSKTLDRKEKQDLTRMSMLFFDVLNNLKLNYTDPTRPRTLMMAEESVKNLIKELLVEMPDTETLQNQYAEIKKSVTRVLNKL